MINAEHTIESKVVKFEPRREKSHLSNPNTKLYNEDTVNKLKRSSSSYNGDYIASDLEEVNSMDSKSTNDILLKYIDNLDKKYDDYKRDMIESEKRIYQNTKDSEDRYEKRRVDESKLYQERQLEFEKRLDDRFKSIENTFNTINTKFDKLESKIDTKLESMSSEIKENNKYLKSLTITTIIGIAAMVISIVAIAISMYFSLLPLLSKI